MSAMAAYIASVSRAMGVAAWKAFQSLDVTDADFTELLKSNKFGGLRRGQSFIDEITGNRYRIIRARGTITGLGYLLKRYLGAAARIGNLTAVSTKSVLQTDDTFVAHDLAGGMVEINAGTGRGQMRFILDNDDTASLSTITVARKDTSFPGNHTANDSPEAFTTQADATSDYITVLPWELVQTAAVTDRVVAVALGAVTSGNWTIVLEEGDGLFQTVGSTDATTLDGGMMPSATAGTAKGPTAAGITAAEAPVIFGSAFEAYGGAADLVFGHIHGRFRIGAH